MSRKRRMDCRVKPGNDEVKCGMPQRRLTAPIRAATLM